MSAVKKFFNGEPPPEVEIEMTATKFVWLLIGIALAAVFFEFPHGSEIFVGIYIFLMIWGVLKFLGDLPKSFSRQHSHGNFIHSHKYDDSLRHHHDDRHPDRVYYS